MNYIDLFAGAGGLSEGFKKVGFNPIVHIEMDKNSCSTLKTRAAFHYLKETNNLKVYNNYLQQKISAEKLYSYIPDSILDSILHVEISNDNINLIFSKIDELRGGKKINCILGGPPCQVYSNIGRSRIGRDNVNKDVRYFLYQQYKAFNHDL